MKSGLRGAAAALALAVLPAQASADVIIHVSFVETHDRLFPDPRPGIVANHDIVATLDAQGHVTESVRHIYPAGGQVAFANSERLGDSSNKVTWRVRGPHRLERIVIARQSIVLAEIEVRDDKTCSAQVKYLPQKGYTDVVDRRDDNRQFAHFTLSQVLSTSCEIR